MNPSGYLEELAERKLQYTHDDKYRIIDLDGYNQYRFRVFDGVKHLDDFIEELNERVPIDALDLSEDLTAIAC